MRRTTKRFLSEIHGPRFDFIDVTPRQPRRRWGLFTLVALAFLPVAAAGAALAAFAANLILH